MNFCMLKVNLCTVKTLLENILLIISKISIKLSEDLRPKILTLISRHRLRKSEILEKYKLLKIIIFKMIKNKYFRSAIAVAGSLSLFFLGYYMLIRKEKKTKKGT